MVVVEDTETPVSITAGAGKDTIVTAGNNVSVDMNGGATKLVVNAGNVELNNYDAKTNAGEVDFTDELENTLLIGNVDATRAPSKLTAGLGNDTALGGASLLITVSTIQILSTGRRLMKLLR